MFYRQINYATQITFGQSALQKLPELLQRRRVTNPLVLTDSGVAKAGLLDKLHAVLRPLAHDVVDDLPSHPTEEAARKICERFRLGGHDGIIGLGGGSVSDFSKAIRLLATDDGAFADYVALDAPKQYPHISLPLIAVPTTSGTGSEISRGLPIWSGGKRLVLLAPELAPSDAVLDPTMTLSLPVGVSVATAFDALSHCVEGYLSPRCGPPFDAVALAGAKRLFKNLPLLLENPENIDVREQIMMGALEGGIAMQLGLGAVHGLGIPLDASGVHHGRIIAALLPHFIHAYDLSNDRRANTLAAEMSGKKRSLHELVKGLADRLGLAERLPINATSEERDAFVVTAMSSPYHSLSPVALALQEYRQVLDKVLAPVEP